MSHLLTKNHIHSSPMRALLDPEKHPPHDSTNLLESTKVQMNTHLQASTQPQMNNYILMSTRVQMNSNLLESPSPR